MPDCANCQRSLAGSELTSKWEDGNNSEAYARCRHCGHKNILWDFGGD